MMRTLALATLATMAFATNEVAQPEAVRKLDGCPDVDVTFTGKTSVKAGQKLKLTCTLDFTGFDDIYGDGNFIGGILVDGLKWKNAKVSPSTKGVTKKATFTEDLYGGAVWWLFDTDYETYLTKKAYKLSLDVYIPKDAEVDDEFTFACGTLDSDDQSICGGEELTVTVVGKSSSSKYKN